MNILLIEDFFEVSHFEYFQQSFEGILFPDGTMTDLYIKAGGKKGSITIGQLQQEINRVNANIPPYHRLNICNNYRDWVKQYESQMDEIFDLDLVIIDIDLSNTEDTSACPNDYKDMKDDFHKKAGIYIYSYLLKAGFPDDNITFLTGNKNELDKLKNSAVHLPKNHFEKGDSQQKDKFKEWLKERLHNKFLIFRKGVKEAYKTLDDHISKIDDKTPNPFLIYETYTDKENEVYENSLDIDGKKDIAKHFLSQLKNMVALNYNTFNRELFTYEVCREWEKGKGEFNSKRLTTMDENERNFKNKLQCVMRTIRNWTSHPVQRNNNKKDFILLSFTFLCAMRGYFDLKNDEILKYENILFCLVPNEKDANYEKDIGNIFHKISSEIKKQSNSNEESLSKLIQKLNDQSNVKKFENKDTERIKDTKKYISENYEKIIYTIVLSSAIKNNLNKAKLDLDENGFPTQLILKFSSLVKN